MFCSTLLDLVVFTCLYLMSFKVTGSPRLGKMRKFHESKEATALDTSFLSVNVESDVDEEDGTLTSSLRNKMSLVDRLLRKYAIKLDCNEVSVTSTISS